MSVQSVTVEAVSIHHIQTIQSCVEVLSVLLFIMETTELQVPNFTHAFPAKAQA